jgi:UDP-glucuronate 4-epimerase
MVMTILNIFAVSLLCIYVCSASPGDLSQTSVLVTGAAGFIGSHLSMALYKEGCRSIVAIDNFDAYYSIYLKRLRADLLTNVTGIKITEGDVCDVSFMKNLFTENSFTHVVHLAAQPGVRYSFVNPLSYIRNNIECFTVLMEQMRLTHNTADRPLPRLLYASSSSVYGLNDKIPFSEEDPVLHPSNLYGATKRADELLAHSYHHLYGMTTIGFRFFTVYGPRGRPDMAAALFTEGILNGRPLTLYNKGELLRDYTYVDDIADGLVAAVARKENDGFIVYNLGNKKPVTTNEFLSLLEGYLGKKAVVKYEDSKADMAVTFANTSLASANLDFHAKTSLDEGLKNYIDWYKAEQRSLMPCVSECSYENICFESGWGEVAAQSRLLTDKCNIVFYTVAMLARTAELHDAPEDSLTCNIAFVKEDSQLFQKIKKQGTGTDLTYNNWVIVPIKDGPFSLRNSRKPSRVPKLNPGNFFAPSVEYAVYGDTSIQLETSVKEVVKHMVMNDNDDGNKAVFAAMRHPLAFVENIFNEFDHVQRHAAKSRPSVAQYPNKVAEHMSACKSYQQKHDNLLFENVFEGSLLVHYLKSPVAKQFRCRWFREYQEWSDRDHLAGAFTTAMMNYDFNKNEKGGENAEWIPIGKYGGSVEYIRILPQSENPAKRKKSDTANSENIKHK